MKNSAKFYFSLVFISFILFVQSCNKKVNNELKPDFYIEYEKQRLAEKQAKKKTKN
jgi:hypothetical protein